MAPRGRARFAGGSPTAAILASHLPEARAAAGLPLAAAVVVGRVASARSPKRTAARLAVAGAAGLASPADALVPDAYREGGPYAGVATVAGLPVAAVPAEV